MPETVPPSRRGLPVPARLAALGLAVAVLVALVVLSLMVGARTIAPGTVVRILLGGEGAGLESAAITDSRLPRTAIAVLAGAGLGVSGALIQAVTRNPLADPGILGVNFGSAFAVALAVGVFGVAAPAGYLWFAFAGALVTTVAVFAIGALGRGSVDPVRLVLAGVAIGAMLSGITSTMVQADPAAFEVIRAWEAGTIADRGWAVVEPVWWAIAVGLVVALLITPSLNAVALGEDLATALGAHVLLTRGLAVVALTLLCGASAAMAGPIAFVGLMIPHVARWVVGPDQRWIAALAMVLGPCLLLAADVVARVLLRSGELPVGVVTAFLGAPVLIWLVRRTGAGSPT